MLEGTGAYISKQKLWVPAYFLCLPLQQFFDSHAYKTKTNPKTCILSFSLVLWVAKFAWYLLVLVSALSILDLQIFMKSLGVAQIN